MNSDGGFARDRAGSAFQARQGHARVDSDHSCCSPRELAADFATSATADRLRCHQKKYREIKAKALCGLAG